MGVSQHFKGAINETYERNISLLKILLCQTTCFPFSLCQSVLSPQLKKQKTALPTSMQQKSFLSPLLRNVSIFTRIFLSHCKVDMYMSLWVCRLYSLFFFERLELTSAPTGKGQQFKREGHRKRIK